MSDRLEPVIEIVDHLGQRQFARELNPLAPNVLVLCIDAPALEAQLDNSAQIPVRHHDRCPDIRLLGRGDLGRVRIK